MGLQLHAEYLSRRLAFSLGALLLLVAMMVSQSWIVAKLNDSWQVRYGDALANFAANAAVDAALNHDLVSLQVILQDVAQSQAVALAQIHDVENNLLVQSGVAPSIHQLEQMPVFHASINYQQNVVGTASVYLQLSVSPARPQLWQYLLLGLLLLLCLGFLLADWPRLVSVTQCLPIDENDSATAVEAVMDSEVEREGASEAFVAVATSEVMIELAQYRHLKQTLSAARLEQVVDDFLKVAELALDIYGGQWALRPQNTLEDGALVALFASPQSEADAVRVAAFFSALVNKAFVNNLARGGIRATVALQGTLCDLPARPSAAMVMWMEEPLVEEFAAQAEIEHIDQHWWSLSAFGRSHDDLLSGQAKQLQAAIE